MKNISERELSDCVNTLDCLTAYEKDIDPIKFYVFVRSGRTKRILEEFVQNRRLEGEYSAGRVIEIVELQKVLCRKWVRDVFRQGMSHEDFVVLLLVGVETQLCPNSWLRRNILRFGDRDMVFRYMQGHGYRLRLSGIRTSLKEFLREQVKYRHLTIWEAICIPYLYCIRKMKYKIMTFKHEAIFKTIIRDMEAHSRTGKAFVDYINEKFSLQGKYEVLSIDNGLYGCTFMKIEISGDSIFIKGNQSDLTNCFYNELEAQKKLTSLRSNNIVSMRYFENGDRRFIAYPYINGTILYRCSLNSSEVEKLGKFLVDIIDILYELQIVHGDIAPFNIMLDDDGNFRLIDFGCACSEGKDILSNNDYIDSMIKGNLCLDWKYDKKIIDDAASAYGVYIFCGGSPEDEYALRLKSLIGRSYTYNS